MASAPDRPPFLSRRSTRVGLAISIVMLLIGAGGAWYVFAAGSHPLTVSNAVERFRGYQPVPADTSGATPSASPSGKPTASPSPGQTSTTSTRTTAKSASAVKPWPSEGVYTYATEGGEETDALSGQSHDYPSSTTISIHHDGCGSIYRWQPLSERWDESEACKTTRGVALHRFSMYHEFFHQGLREDFACGSDAIVMPWVQRAGDHWNFRCKSSGTTLDMTVRVVGFESVPVGGRSIRAVHIRYDGTVSGDDTGTQTQDRWLAVDDGLFLRIVSYAKVTSNGPFGRINYLEHYRIDLKSTSPQS